MLEYCTCRCYMSHFCIKSVIGMLLRYFGLSKYTEFISEDLLLLLSAITKFDLKMVRWQNNIHI